MGRWKKRRLKTQPNVDYEFYNAYRLNKFDTIYPNININLKNLASLEYAQNAKKRINKELRGSNTRKSKDYDYDYVLDILVASNMELHYKAIINIMNHKYYPSEKMSDDEYMEEDRVRIYRAQKKIGRLINSEEDASDRLKCVSLYLDSINYCSYSQETLNMFVDAIIYYHSTTSFIDRSGNTLYMNWETALQNNNIKKSQLKFLSRFSTEKRYSRCKVERYLVTLNYKECFSICDIEYIIKEFTTKSNKINKYTESDLFKELSIIKNTRK